MDWFIPLVAFIASWLTFFSGFGLGTLLMAVLACYFSPDIAIAYTALVHFASNTFKLLLNRKIDWDIFKKFGLVAIVSAILGSMLLDVIADSDFVLYDLLRFGALKPVKLLSFTVGLMLIVFSLFEWKYKSKAISIPLWLGGVLSGFFGGISGHQGALRSAFLSKRIPDVHRFVATTALISWCVDIGRISVYNWRMEMHSLSWILLISTISSALIGVVLGTILIKKATIPLVQHFVVVYLFLLGLGMITGWV